MEDEFLDQNEEDDEDEKFRNRQTLSVPKPEEESSFNERSEDEEDSSPKIVIQPAEAEGGEPPKKQETFKFNQNEMQETLKLIQKVTTSILEKGNESFKSKAKPHVTRIVAQQAPETAVASPGNSS